MITPSVLESNKKEKSVKCVSRNLLFVKRESVKNKERFSEDLNRILNKWSDLCLDWNRAKRVQEKREANERLNLKKRELEILVREIMKSPGTAIKVYEKLSRLLTQVIKHRPSVQYLVLNSIVEKIDKVYKKAN